MNPSAGIVISSSVALLTSVTKLGDWIDVISLLFEKTLKTSMVDETNDGKEAEELNKIYNHYLDKLKKIMKNSSFRVEYVFGDVITKDSISPEQMTKLNSFLRQNNVNNNFSIENKTI